MKEKHRNFERANRTVGNIQDIISHYSTGTGVALATLEVLSDISISVAVIADALTAQRRIETEDSDDGK